MSTNSKVVVVGLGEIGKPLLQLISERHEVIGVDISPVGQVDNVDVLHVCYPFQIKDFIGETARYIEFFKPSTDGDQQHGGSRDHTSHRRANWHRGSQQPGARQACSNARRASLLHEVCGCARSGRR